jgi:diguanylate cyclase (GGDEF)-like protein/PAS domain S-box-containing protein
MLRVVGCITHEHDLRLVTLAACICALASFTTLALIARAQAVTSRASCLWLVASAAVFGCGVWSLHFVAMLAFMPGMPIAFDVGTTLGSALVAIAGALVAFLAWRLAPSRPAGIVLGGILLGLAVSGMHYFGIAAMRLPGSFRFDSQDVAASIAVSIGFGMLALARAETLATLTRRIEVSGWLALCVCGLHFTGMAALTIQPGPFTKQAGAVLGSGPLAVAVGSVSLAILFVSLAATLMEQHLSQRAILELKRMRLLSNISQEVMIIHRDGVILQVNEAGARLFRVPAERLVGRRILDLVAEADRPTVLRRGRGGPDDRKPEEIQVRNAAGTLIPVELFCSTLDYEGKAATAVALRDLSDHKRDQERIRHLAHHDALTDLPNRFLLLERLAHALDAADLSGGAVALLYLDLDRFKAMNDVLGHAGGDALLAEVAGRLRGLLRLADTLARVGGDEFMIVTSSADHPERVAALAAKLMDMLGKPFEIEGNRVEIGASIGIALYPGDAGGQETLMRAAATALYRAKEEKRGTFRFFEAAMDEHLHARRQLEQDLRYAVDRGEFQLHYQPLLSCVTGEIAGFEALLRWQHPRRGLVPPMEFIPAAEETGLIVGIGEWVIETACEAAAGWDQPRWVAVNVSPVQFRQSDLPNIVAAALARTGLPPERLEIEITEGILMEDTRRALDVLSALRAQGVRIALDDFGTGYSSLSYLRSFTFDKLKIDKSFIQGLGQSDGAATIVRTIIGLAHNLGLSIVAEGVENQQQLAIVRGQMCDQVQGYLLGRPMQMNGFTELAAARAKKLLLAAPIVAAE